MPSTAVPSRSAALRRTLPLWTLVFAAGGLGAAFWWTRLPPRPTPIDSRWTATAFVLAGDGNPGVRDGSASKARFSDPFGVAIGIDGTVYVADAGDAQRIRAVTPDGRVFTAAGGDPGFADGVGAAAKFDAPSGLAVDTSGTLYVADTGNNAVRRVTADGRVSTLAGDGVAGYRDGPAAEARFNGPLGVAVDLTGRIIVADTYNDRIRAISPDGTVTTLAGGSQPGLVDAVGADARFDTPSGVAVDRAGRIYVADTGNGFVRIIDARCAVTTAPMLSEGPIRPVGIAVGAEGDVYVSDERGRIVAMLPGGDTRTLAGSTPGFRDGPGSNARFRAPAGLALAGPRRLVVADARNALVRMVADRTRLGPRPPPSPLTAPAFDVGGFAWQPLLWPVAPLEGPHEIAGTLGEARGGEGTERFHAGIDVRIGEGTMVYAVREGTVVSPSGAGDFGSINEWLRIGPIGYVHIRAGRGRANAVFDPARFVPTYDDHGTLVGMRVKRGARFATGDVIGTVNRFNHVHLNVGWPGEEQNPLRFRLTQFVDTVPPTIARRGVRLFDDRGALLDRRVNGRTLVSGRVQVVVDAWDQSNGNRPSRRLGPYDLGYQLLERDGSPAPGFDAPRHTIRFDRLAADAEAARLVYAPGSGIPFYGQRRTRFLYIVTNTFRDGVAAPGFWDTTGVAPGDYILRAWVADISGNVATANRDLPITIEPDGVGRVW